MEEEKDEESALPTDGSTIGATCECWWSALERRAAIDFAHLWKSSDVLDGSLGIDLCDRDGARGILADRGLLAGSAHLLNVSLLCSELKEASLLREGRVSITTGISISKGMSLSMVFSRIVACFAVV